MTIPAGHVIRVITGHSLIFNDNILEHLVERGAEVNVSVCIRRTVVQRIGGLALVLLGKRVVHTLALPLLQHFRLSLGQIAAHRKIGLRQIYRTVKIH